MSASTRAAQRRKARRQRSSVPVFPIVAGTIVVLFVTAVVFTRSEGGGTDASLQETAAVTLTGEPLPELAGEGDPAVGMTAPEIRGETFEGSPIAIENDGRPKAIVFVAHWCPHCQVEIPKIQSWLDSGGDTRGVDIVTIATATDEGQPNFPPSRWLADEGWTPPVLVDDPDYSTAGAFGVSGYPFFVFIAADGVVTARTSGEIPIEDFEVLLERTAGQG